MKTVDFEFKGTKDVFKIVTRTTQGTPMCLPNNTIYAGSIKLAQVFGNNREEATFNTILLSKAPEMIKQHIDDLDYLKSWFYDLENGNIMAVMQEMKNVFYEKYKLVNEATRIQ